MMPRARLNFQTFQIQILIQKDQVQLYLLRYSLYHIDICWAVILV